MFQEVAETSVTLCTGENQDALIHHPDGERDLVGIKVLFQQQLIEITQTLILVLNNGEQAFKRLSSYLDLMGVVLHPLKHDLHIIGIFLY